MMLKKIKLKDKDIPVPVPVKTLSEAVAWIEQTLVPEGSILTSITLNGQEKIDIKDQPSAKKVVFDGSEEISVKIETPKDLSIQSLDAVRDLAMGVSKKIKKTAVKCWNMEKEEHPAQLMEILDDIKLVVGLVDHINGLMDYTQEELAPVNGIKNLILRSQNELTAAKNRNDYKKVSVLLVNRYEGLLKELVHECEVLQLNIYSSGAQKTSSQG